MPLPKVGMRQQLDLWARQAATVRAGNLQLTCELTDLDELGCAQLSPHADCVAACTYSVAACVYSDEYSAVLLPVMGTQQALGFDLSAQPPSQPLTLPSSEPEEVLISQFCWSPTGRHLVIVSEDGSETPPSCVRISTFRGTQLVGSFREPLENGEAPQADVHFLEDEAALLLAVWSSRGHRMVACTPQGVVTARHPRVLTTYSAASLDSGRILRASQAGDRLCICSATCVQEILLQRSPAPQHHVAVSCWGGAATVLLVSDSQATAVELLFVGLERQAVQHSVARPACIRCNDLKQGARSVALAGLEQVQVVSCSGKDVGRELFRCQGRSPAWNSLGRFLAVLQKTDGHQCVSVLDGLTGAPVAALAVWPAYKGLEWLRWLPDSSGMEVQKMGAADAGDGVLSWSILGFAGPGALDM